MQTKEEQMHSFKKLDYPWSTYRSNRHAKSTICFHFMCFHLNFPLNLFRFLSEDYVQHLIINSEAEENDVVVI